jgi:hypothetical protein
LCKTNCAAFQLLSCPGEGRGNGHRTSFSTGRTFRLPETHTRSLLASGLASLLSLTQSKAGFRVHKLRRRTYFSKALIQALFSARIQVRIQEARAPHFGGGSGPSHLWLGAKPLRLLTAAFQIPPHSRGAEFTAWDCKVTPASCTCQEGTTIGCIPSNDGLDAGSRPFFPHGEPAGGFGLGQWVDISGVADKSRVSNWPGGRQRFERCVSAADRVRKQASWGKASSSLNRAEGGGNRKWAAGC